MSLIHKKNEIQENSKFDNLMWDNQVLQICLNVFYPHLFVYSQSSPRSFGLSVKLILVKKHDFCSVNLKVKS